MKWLRIMCNTLDEAQEVIDSATMEKDVVTIDYAWDNVNDKHIFYICYEE